MTPFFLPMFPSWCSRFFLCGVIGGILWTPYQSAADELLDTEVETLAPIEVPGTIVIQEQRKFPKLEITIDSVPPIPEKSIIVPVQKTERRQFGSRFSRINFRDNIAETLGTRTPVTPIKAERPPYPRVAREQGWKGTVILRLEILPNGTVGTITLTKTSGHPLLDQSAIRSVRQWRFKPAKDGEFPIRSVVDLPVKFDLHQ